MPHLSRHYSQQNVLQCRRVCSSISGFCTIIVMPHSHPPFFLSSFGSHLRLSNRCCVCFLHFNFFASFYFFIFVFFLGPFLRWLLETLSQCSVQRYFLPLSSHKQDAFHLATAVMALLLSFC